MTTRSAAAGLCKSVGARAARCLSRIGSAATVVAVFGERRGYRPIDLGPAVERVGIAVADRICDPGSSISDPAPLVLAFGDSLVAGYGLPPADGFVAQLQRRLRATRPDARVVGAGMPGDTAADALRRLPRVLSGLERRPDLAIVQLGPNDVLRQSPPAATRASLDAILVEFGRCGVPVLLTTVAPPPILLDRAAPYVGLHAALAERHGATLWPFFPAGVLGHPDMVLADRVHPNGKAIAAVVDAMLPAIERALPA